MAKRLVQYFEIIQIDHQQRAQQVLNALFYLARTGCAWRMLPKGYPPKETVHQHTPV